MGESFRERLLDASARIPVARELHHVYALWIGEEIVYVGYTSALATRIAEHMRVLWADYDAFTCVPFATKREALAAESDMIHALKPRLNVDHSARRGYVPQSQRERAPTAREVAQRQVWEAHCAAACKAVRP